MSSLHATLEDFLDWAAAPYSSYYEDELMSEKGGSHTELMGKIRRLLGKDWTDLTASTPGHDTGALRLKALIDGRDVIVSVEPGYDRGTYTITATSVAAKDTQSIREDDDELDDDGGESESGDKEFYVTIRDHDNVWIARVFMDDGDRSWQEEEWEVLHGECDYNFGGKTYMSYLSPADIASWFSRDYTDVSPPRTTPYRHPDEPGTDEFLDGLSTDDDDLDEDASGGAVGGGAVAGGDSTVPAPDAGIPRRRIPINTIKETSQAASMDDAKKAEVVKSAAKIYRIDDPYAIKAMERVYILAFGDGARAQIDAGGISSTWPK